MSAKRKKEKIIPYRKERTQYLEERIQYLEEVNRYTLDALELAAFMGNFYTDFNKLGNISMLLDETISRIQRLIRLQAMVLFLVDEDTKDIFPAKAEPESYSPYIQSEVDFLIEKGTYAWAVRERRPVVVSTEDYKKKLIVHVIATSHRIRGMFVGLLEKDKTDISDISLSLLSIILLNSANAIENFELYNVIKKREKTLKQAFKELKDTQAQLIQSGKLASIGELAAGIAHELNQPLMVLRGNVQLIKRSMRKNILNMDELTKQFEPIERNTKRMMNIINHLIIFSRQSESKSSSVNINKIIEDCFLMLGEQLRLRNIEVRKDLSADLPQIHGNANQLEQVFLNLISNARDTIEARDEERRTRNDPIKGRNEFRGRLEITTRMGETDNQQSTINNRQSKDFIEILFKDNGGGISADKGDKIFDPFFTTKEVGKGTGLGLSISYGIIEKHKGRIEVADTGPDGTTFRIKLPVLNIED